MVIEVNELVVRHGDLVAVDGVSFNVAPGEVVALLGPNGAGKTTLLETLEGYHRPAGGQVRVLGHDPATDRHTISTRWGVMPQSGGFPMGVTVGEAVRLFAALYGVEERVAPVLAASGLESLVNRRWRRLSGGEQQRLSLALALCGGSELLLLDEPTAAVDADGRERILHLIASRAEAGAAVLVTTHRFDDVERVADRAIILDHGRAVATGTLAELTTVDDRIEFGSITGLDTDGLASRLGHTVTETRRGWYCVAMSPSPTAVDAINRWLADQGTMAESMLAGRRSLESRFLELTAEPAPEEPSGGDEIGGRR